MLVRKAKQSDLAALLLLEQLSFPDPWSEAGMKEELTLPRAHYFVAEEDGKVVGFAGFWHMLTEAEIMKVCVHPDFRRHGAASALLCEVYKCAKALGAEDVILEVRAGNAPARALYEKEGFCAYNVRKNYYQQKEDAVLYRRSL